MATNKQLKIAFFGTDRLSVAVLEALKSADMTPVVIIAPPDKPVGRKQVITPPPTKLWANENDVDILQPEKLKDDDFVGELTNTDWDLFVVASYGKIIPNEILDLPKFKTLNVHPSLLPKLRGSSPIKTSILNDDRETGVTIMIVTEEMDAGPIVSQASITIEKNEWPLKASVLRGILAEAGGELLVEVIPEWVSNSVTPEEQSHDDATYTNKFTKEDGLINLNDDPYKNYLKIQAFEEWPGTYFFVEHDDKKTRVKITDASYENNALVINRVIPEGKKEMDYKDFLRK